MTQGRGVDQSTQPGMERDRIPASFLALQQSSERPQAVPSLVLYNSSHQRKRSIPHTHQALAATRPVGNTMITKSCQAALGGQQHRGGFVSIQCSDRPEQGLHLRCTHV